MLFNHYEGCVEQWKMDLVAKRASLFGFQEEDISDIQQELVLKLMEFKYAADKANGAKESTALQRVIDNELKMKIRSQKRNAERMEALRCFTELAQTPLNIYLTADIQNALFCLPKLQRQICIDLSKGCTTAEIAHLLKISQRTVQRHIRKIAHYFRTIGLDRWLQG